MGDILVSRLDPGCSLSSRTPLKNKRFVLLKSAYMYLDTSVSYPWKWAGPFLYQGEALMLTKATFRATLSI